MEHIDVQKIINETIVPLRMAIEAQAAELEQVVQELEAIRRVQIKEGPLAPLAKALAYHHEMVNGWAAIAKPDVLDDPPTYQELHAEFVKMRKVVTHYEYVAQQLLGINPSPLADLEGN